MDMNSHQRKSITDFLNQINLCALFCVSPTNLDARNLQAQGGFNLKQSQYVHYVWSGF